MLRTARSLGKSRTGNLPYSRWESWQSPWPDNLNMAHETQGKVPTPCYHQVHQLLRGMCCQSRYGITRLYLLQSVQSHTQPLQPSVQGSGLYSLWSELGCHHARYQGSKSRNKQHFSAKQKYILSIEHPCLSSPLLSKTHTHWMKCVSCYRVIYLVIKRLLISWRFLI